MGSFGMIQNPSKLSLFFSKLTSKINKKVKIAFTLLLLVALGMFLYNAYQRAYKPLISTIKTITTTKPIITASKR